MVSFGLRRFIWVLGVLGCVIFSAFFALSYSKPAFIEETAKDIIRYRLQAVTQEKVDALSENALFNSARVLMRQHEKEIEFIKQQLANGMPEKIAAVIAEMRNPDCECRSITGEQIRDAMNWRIGSLSQMQQQLISFMQSKYMEIAGHLKREFRIFTGSSAFVFLVLLAAAVFQRGAGVQLLLPAGLLLISTVITAYFYVFGQNWLHTILFSSYVGFAYLAYIGIIFAFLCDIVFNGARVTNMILSAIHSFLTSLREAC